METTVITFDITSSFEDWADAYDKSLPIQKEFGPMSTPLAILSFALPVLEYELLSCFSTSDKIFNNKKGFIRAG